MLGLFNKSKSLEESLVLSGSVDNHCHVMWGLDDGVASKDESLSILGYMESLGVSRVVFTPHTMSDMPNTTEGILKRFAELKAVYTGKMELDVASEYMMDILYLEHLEAKDLLCHGSERVLVESSIWNETINMASVLERTMRTGYWPILAHPERYLYLDLSALKSFKEKGILFQLNLPSIVGFYGKTVQERAKKILKNGWYDMTGSDCHRYSLITRQYASKSLDKKTLDLLRPLLLSL